MPKQLKAEYNPQTTEIEISTVVAVVKELANKFDGSNIESFYNTVLQEVQNIRLDKSRFKGEPSGYVIDELKFIIEALETK